MPLHFNGVRRKPTLCYRDTSQDTLMNFTEDACQQSSDTFPVQFLSMPDLDAEPQEEKSGVELLTEFNIDNDTNQGIARKIGDGQEIDHNSLNCVLPSISNDHIDDISMAEASILYSFNALCKSSFL